MNGSALLPLGSSRGSRCSEQFLQTTSPQLRQWCFRFVILKFVWQQMQLVAVSSGVHSEAIKRPLPSSSAIFERSFSSETWSLLMLSWTPSSSKVCWSSLYFFFSLSRSDLVFSCFFASSVWWLIFNCSFEMSSLYSNSFDWSADLHSLSIRRSASHRLLLSSYATIWVESVLLVSSSDLNDAKSDACLKVIDKNYKQKCNHKTIQTSSSSTE